MNINRKKLYYQITATKRDGSESVSVGYFSSRWQTRLIAAVSAVFWYMWRGFDVVIDHRSAKSIAENNLLLRKAFA